MSLHKSNIFRTDILIFYNIVIGKPIKAINKIKENVK